MTNDSPKSTDNNPSQPDQIYQGCSVMCASVFMIPLGLYWLITGEVSIPYQGVYITGSAARIFAVLLIIFIIRLIKSTIVPKTKKWRGQSLHYKGVKGSLHCSIMWSETLSTAQIAAGWGQRKGAVMNVVFVHGWSTTNTDTYGYLPKWLSTQKGYNVSNICLGKYISLKGVKKGSKKGSLS